MKIYFLEFVNPYFEKRTSVIFLCKNAARIRVVTSLFYPLNNGHMYPSKNGQAIHKNTEDNNIRNNNITNKKGEKNYNPGYEGRKYPDEFFNQFYANLN